MSQGQHKGSSAPCNLPQQRRSPLRGTASQTPRRVPTKCASARRSITHRCSHPSSSTKLTSGELSNRSWPQANAKAAYSPDDIRNGKSHFFNAPSGVMLAGISLPAFDPATESRTVQVQLEPLPEQRGHDNPLLGSQFRPMVAGGCADCWSRDGR